VALQKTKAVYAASERQYTATGGEGGSPGGWYVQVTEGGTRITDIDTQVGSVNAVLRELLRFVVTKREFSNTANLSVFKSVLFQS